MSKFLAIETIYSIADNPDFINQRLTRRKTLLMEDRKIACRHIDSSLPFEVVTMEELLSRVENIGPHVYYIVADEGLDAINKMFGWSNEDHYKYIHSTYLY